MRFNLSVNPINYYYAAVKNRNHNSSEKSFSERMAESNNSVSSDIKSGLPLSSLIIPTYDDIKELSVDLKQKIGKKLRESGIKTDLPVDIKVNVRTLEVEVTGDRADLQEIKDILNNDEDIKEKLFSLNAFTEFLAALPDHLAFQDEYRVSNNPEAVVNKYAHLFSSMPVEHNIKFTFTEGKFDIYYDDNLWDNMMKS
ncbi:MAG: hypothetical protein R6W90_19030 [Ignavibacteriaceae bacterium]